MDARKRQPEATSEAREPNAAEPAEPPASGGDASGAGRRVLPRDGQRRGGGWLQTTHHLERALVALLSVVLVGSVMAIGSVHTVVLVPFAALSIATALVALPLHRVEHPEGGWPSPALILLALSLFCAVQCVPLPLGFLDKIAHANADIWARSLLPFGEHPTWGSISLDPGATMVEALKWLSYACVFFGASTLAARRGTAWVVAIVYASATLLAIVTLLHGMADAKKIFGIYQPTGSFPPHHIGPLLNTNNLAGYLNLGALAGIGLVLMRRPILRPWLVAVGVAVDIGAIVRSASRGGLGALLIGVLVVAALAAGRSSTKASSHDESASGPSPRRAARALRQRLAPLVLAGATVVFGGALAFLGGDVWVWRELLNDNLAKLKIVAWTVPLLREYAWLGVGRGAFESVFEAYRPASGYHIIYTHPENFPAQWASEWGIVVAGAALFTLAWLFRPGAVGVRRSAVAAGAWVAVLAVAIQNLADLGLEIPALGLATAVTLGGLWGDPTRRTRKKRSALSRLAGRIGARPVTYYAVLAGAVFGVLSLVLCYRDVGQQRDVLRESFERAEDDASLRAPFRAELMAAMKRRPAEHYFPLLGAMAAFRWKDQSPMPWLQHTLERAPVNGRAHALLASVLASKGARKQALLEIRLAVEHEPGLSDTAMPLATALARNFDELMIAVPEGPRGAIVLSMMARSLGKPEQAGVRAQVDAAALERDPTLVEPRARLLSGLFASIGDLSHGKTAGVCPTIDACVADVERHAAAIDAAKPESSLGAVMRARGLIAAGKRPQAEELLSSGCARPEGRAECLQVRVENLTAIGGDGTKLDAALKEYMSDGCTSAPACAAAATFVGSVRAQRGDRRGAAMAFLRAAQDDPTEERWLRAADAAESAKMSVQALEALQRVASLRGGVDSDVAARQARIKAALAAEQMMRF